MLKMATNISLINNINTQNLINLMMSNTAGSSSSSLNSLLSNTGSSKSSLLSSTAAKEQQAVNLNTLNLMTAAGTLTSGNPQTVFTGAKTQDATKIQKAVTTFVTTFNKAVDSLSGSSSAVSNQSAEKLTALAGANSKALSAIGITIDDEGKLVVNSAKLKAAATSSQTAVQTAFNGSNSFASKVASISRSSISQSLGITSNAGFLSMYTSGLGSSASSLFTSNSFFSAYM
jgi:hypothetical protein